MKHPAIPARKAASEVPSLRLRLTRWGAVHGVGFRPFIYRLATGLGLGGWVSNSSQGVLIEVEGGQSQLEEFLLRIEAEKPPRSSIQSLETSFLDPVGHPSFEVRHSDESGEKTALLLPDIATCADCLQEIFEPANRRYRYPFTNCTNCGPRFSIIEALPYDRANTTMANFTMCGHCHAEYENPVDRRFHAQPNACPQCGPHLELSDREGKVLAFHHEALLAAADGIRRGAIVAVKGLGGFHLLADARSKEVVWSLRQRKRREEKPLALMFPSLDLVREQCEVSSLEGRLLCSPESPIVLLRRKAGYQPSALAPSVAPGNPCLGVMLPCTPLHHLLMAELGFPVVATSGNVSNEPICTDEHEALRRLGGIADVFLVHNRPIARHADDSIVRVVMGRELVLRRARGYAPLPLQCRESLPPVLAVGAHLKSTVAISVGKAVFVSQHIGDLETMPAVDAFGQVVASLSQVYDFKPAAVACDLHPDYVSTRFAEASGVPLVRVQHHYAHVLACMAENELDSPVLGVAWDGTGYGPDGTIWGGEFLGVTESSFQRAGHFRTFRLAGGDQAIREPRRAAAGLLYEVFGEEISAMQELAPVQAFSAREFELVQTMLKRKLNAPLTSSAGRLFDAVAAIVGLRQKARFEGQAAMELEFALDGVETDEAYPFRLSSSQLRDSALFYHRPSAIVADWEPMVRSILEDLRHGIPVGKVSAKFHNTLAGIIVAMARRAGTERIVLTGGCFQNTYLTERAVRRLEAEGFRPYSHQRVPPNDGGIALGQAVAALRERPKE
jgi:hydrogenase maturation protein HypF